MSKAYFLSGKGESTRSCRSTTEVPAKVSYHSDTSIERLLDIAELAEILSVPRSWIYKRLRTDGTGRLPGIKLGKYWRFRDSDIRDWLEKRPRA
jgi:excisionase family DNA binding protein